MGQAGDTAKGALGGAATGAAIGSVAGPYGALIGGGIGAIGGGIAGYFGSGDDDAEAQQRRLDEYRQTVLGRDLPQLGPAAQASTSGFRGNQQGLIDRLDALSRGQGPSVADEQLKAATERNTALQQSVAQSGHGNATLANLVAANNSNTFGQSAAQTGTYARLAEQQQANQLYSQTLAQARGGDEELSRFNAQQQNFARQANLEAKLRAIGLTDESIIKIMAQQGQAANAGPTTGDQLLAGGIGALGQYAANSRKTPTASPAMSQGTIGGGQWYAS